MGIRNVFRTIRGHGSVSSSASSSSSDKKKYTKNVSKRRLFRRSQQYWSSTNSEDTWCSCGSSSISFSETVKIQEIDPLTSLTDTPEDLWYQKEEYSNFQKRNRQLARYAETCDKDVTRQEKKRVCTRGLERLLLTEARCTRKQDARLCVMSAQRLMLGDEGVALAYHTVAKESAAVAQERASNDAKEIEMYLRQ